MNQNSRPNRADPAAGQSPTIRSGNTFRITVVNVRRSIGKIQSLAPVRDAGEAVAKETDGSETMEYPAKWTIKDGKLLFLVDTNTFSIAYNEEGGTESLLLYDDSDQLRGIFTPSDKE